MKYYFYLLMSLSMDVFASSNPDILNAYSFIKMLFILIAIIGLMFLLNKIAVKKFSSLGGDKMKVISSIPVGQKERLVLVEVEGEKILVGVSTGYVKHISTIHTNKAFKHTENV